MHTRPATQSQHIYIVIYLGDRQQLPSRSSHTKVGKAMEMYFCERGRKGQRQGLLQLDGLRHKSLTHICKPLDLDIVFLFVCLLVLWF